MTYYANSPIRVTGPLLKSDMVLQGRDMRKRTGGQRYHWRLTGK